MSAAPLPGVGWIATPKTGAPLAFDTLQDMAVHILDLARPKDVVGFTATIYLPGDNIAAQQPRPCVLIRATSRFGGETVCYAHLAGLGPETMRDKLFTAIVDAGHRARDPDRYRPEGEPKTPAIPAWALEMIQEGRA